MCGPLWKQKNEILITKDENMKAELCENSNFSASKSIRELSRLWFVFSLWTSAAAVMCFVYCRCHPYLVCLAFDTAHFKMFNLCCSPSLCTATPPSGISLYPLLFLLNLSPPGWSLKRGTKLKMTNNPKIFRGRQYSYALLFSVVFLKTFLARLLFIKDSCLWIAFSKISTYHYWNRQIP